MLALEIQRSRDLSVEVVDMKVKLNLTTFQVVLKHWVI